MVGWRASRMPEPAEPEACKPTRTAVKIARPWARAMTLEGMVTRTGGFFAGGWLVVVEEEVEMVVVVEAGVGVLAVGVVSL